MTPKLKKNLKWLGAAVLSWLLGKLLDISTIFEKATEYFTSLDTQKKSLGFLNYSIPLWKLSLWVVGMIIIYKLLSLRFGKQARLERLQAEDNNYLDSVKKIIGKDNRRIVNDDKLLIKYDVVFNEGKVGIKNAVPYCNLHDPPLKMAYNEIAWELQCSDPRCPHRFSHMPRLSTNPFITYQNLIVSDLEDLWEQLTQGL
jgi:hypothetical protein